MRMVRLEIEAAGSTYGNDFRVTTYGESNGGGVGCIIDGCPPRLPLSEVDMQVELDRRRPGQSRITTPRKETDTCKILSGISEGFLLLMRVIAVTFCVTLAASMAARLGPTPMAAFQVCLQVWLTTSLLADGLAVAGQVDVNGNNAAPLYKFLKSSKGVIFGDSIKWNFSKFLVVFIFVYD